MPSCCETSDLKNAPRDGLTIALAGNPNSGKTTLFNALTGLKQKVANYPGVTVEKKTGTCKLPDGSRVNIIDLPGTYSLISRSPDELIAMQVLRGLRPDVPPIDVVIVVVDASNLQRNLYLVSQLIELGRPLVVALNMMDVAERRGLHVSADRLSHQLGVPVVSIVGHKKQGVKELKSAIAKATVAPMPNWDLPQEMRDELALVAGALGIQLSESSIKPTSTYPALAERLLINDHATDLAPVAKQDPVRSLLGSATSRLNQFGIDPIQADIEAHYQWIDQVTAASLIPACERISNSVLSPQSSVLDYAPKPTFTEKLDRLLIHKIWGLAIFALIMGTLFVTIFWAAAPIMDALQSAVTSLGTLAVSHLSDGPLRDLVKDGIFKGVGAVLVFVPQIALLFMFLSILEDSGYLARAAFLMDRLLSKVGLQGKSFIPLLSSFACAIPGVLATRTIENRKERLATILVLPFMSCSARLPVYTLLIGTFFASYGPLRQAGIMLALYALGIVAAAGTAFIFKRTLMRGPATTFILELPTYKLPQLSQVARQVWTNSKEFVTKAGTTIFCLSVILWALMYYPRMSESRATQVADAWKPTYANIEAALTPPPPPLPTPNPRNLRQIGQTPMALVNESIAHFTRCGNFRTPFIATRSPNALGVSLVSSVTKL